MTTYADLQTQIADEIDDTTGYYSQQIKYAIQASIRFCERRTYYFNQTRDVTFSTVNGQQFYGASDNSNIPTLINIDAAWTEDQSGQRYILQRAQETDMEYLSDNSAATGQPYAFAYFNQKIRLYPIPGAYVYTVRLQLGPYRLTPLVNQSDTNAWLSEAYDLVKARAKYILGKDIMKDANVATEALNDFNDQDAALKLETSSRNGTGVIRATSF